MDYLSDQYDMFTEAASKTLSSQRASKSPSLPSLNATVTAGKYGTPSTLLLASSVLGRSGIAPRDFTS